MEEISLLPKECGTEQVNSPLKKSFCSSQMGEEQGRGKEALALESPSVLPLKKRESGSLTHK